ncbi:MAG: response regulator transcription factor [Chloroflexi bacterium]|nr:response regulator transcription factor [Chloroflexota bacterium]
MVNGLRLADDGQRTAVDLLEEQGVPAVLISSEADLDALTSRSGAGLALLDIGAMSRPEIEVCAEACSRARLPVLALVTRARLRDFESLPAINDFVLIPPDAAELVTRAKFLVARARSHEGPDVIRVRELVINPTTYEVSVRGRRVHLRFKEYELLRLLAANAGRVYTRDALLRQIWGYDYFGGTRTVDVHIRRLRSKIEDADNSFIETIWNVGYRFKS